MPGREDTNSIDAFFNSMSEGATKGFKIAKSLDELKNGQKILVLQRVYATKANLGYCFVKIEDIRSSGEKEASVRRGSVYQGYYDYAKRKCTETMPETSIPSRARIGKSIDYFVIRKDELDKEKVYIMLERE